MRNATAHLHILRLVAKNVPQTGWCDNFYVCEPARMIEVVLATMHPSTAIQLLLWVQLQHNVYQVIYTNILTAHANLHKNIVECRENAK